MCESVTAAAHWHCSDHNWRASSLQLSAGKHCQRTQRMSSMASNCTRQTPQALRMLKRCLAAWSLLLLCLLSPAAPADNAQGYYREEGLDVRLHQGAPGKTPVEEVLAGRAQYAESNSELLYERLNGKPLVALAALFQHSPSVLLARADAGIRTVHDLLGKRVMLMNAQTDADFLTMFRREGMDAGRIQLQPSSYAIEDLASGKVDAFNSYLTNEPYFLQQQGIDYVVISPSTYGIDFYSDILFTSEAEVEEHSERGEAFRLASLRGWRYAMDHPEEIIELLLKQYQVPKSLAHLQFEAQVMRSLILPDLVEIGHMNPGRWQRMAEAFLEQNMVPDTSMLEGFSYDPNPPQQVKRLQRIIVVISLGAALALAVTLALLAIQ